jgi:hypothetical protein
MDESNPAEADIPLHGSDHHAKAWAYIRTSAKLKVSSFSISTGDKQRRIIHQPSLQYIYRTGSSTGILSGIPLLYI